MLSRHSTSVEQTVTRSICRASRPARSRAEPAAEGGNPLIGGQALHPDVNKSGHMAYFQGYNDPSETMNPWKRDIMLRKSFVGRRLHRQEGNSSRSATS